MVFLVLLIMATAIILAVYAFFLLGKSDLKEKEGEKELSITELEDKIRSLTSTLRNTKSDYTNLQNELRASQKKESDLKQELIRLKDCYNKEQAALEQSKKDNLRLKDELLNKVKKSTDVFPTDVKLNTEMKEITEKLQLLENKNIEKDNEIASLRMQLEKYIQESKPIAELKKRYDLVSLVPKVDYDQLRNKYDELKKQFQIKEQLEKEQSVEKQPQQE